MTVDSLVSEMWRISMSCMGDKTTQYYIDKSPRGDYVYLTPVFLSGVLSNNFELAHVKNVENIHELYE